MCVRAYVPWCNYDKPDYTGFSHETSKRPCWKSGRAVQKTSELLRDKQLALEKRIRQQQEEETKAKREVEEQRRHLEEEKKAMANVYNFQSSRLTLDVGGCRFRMSWSTLTKDPESMLAAMFSGRHELMPDEEGAYFIDRDGAHFRYILNHLRDGDAAYLPNEKTLLEELLREARFYQLRGLSETIGKLLTPQLSEREVKIELGLQPFSQTFVIPAFIIPAAPKSKWCFNVVSCSTRVPSFEEKFILDLKFSGIWFKCQLSFRKSVLKNVLFEECYFCQGLDFSGADLTNVSFIHCGNLGDHNLPVVVGASKDGLTFDIANFKQKLLF